MYSFSYLEPVCCSMSSSNCCFLTCIQISQQADQVVWYSHLLKNFPQFVMIHTGKGFGIVNKAEIDVFLELPCFFDDPADVGNLISDSSAFSKLFQLEQLEVHGSHIAEACLENFKHYFTSVWDECNCAVVWTFFGIGMKTDLFQSYGHCWVFQTCWHIECSTFTASSFRIWNSSTGIPSPPLALFVVMLPKTHLTSHSRMSDNITLALPNFKISDLKNGGSVVKNAPAKAGDSGSIPGSGKFPEKGNGNPLQYFCLGNPMHRGSWQATVHGVTKESDTT